MRLCWFVGKRWFRSTLPVTAVALAVAFGSSTPASTQSLTPLYHWAYPGNGDQFYTTSSSSPGSGWNYIEVTGYVYTSQVDGTVPLYQFSTAGDHFYSLSSSTPPGYNYEGPCCYVFSSQIVGTVPLFRYFSCCGGVAVSHYYTTTQGGPGYPWTVYEGVEGYVSAP